MDSTLRLLAALSFELPVLLCCWRLAGRWTAAADLTADERPLWTALLGLSAAVVLPAPLVFLAVALRLNSPTLYAGAGVLLAAAWLGGRPRNGPQATDRTWWWVLPALAGLVLLTVAARPLTDLDSLAYSNALADWRLNLRDAYHRPWLYVAAWEQRLLPAYTLGGDLAFLWLCQAVVLAATAAATRLLTLAVGLPAWAGRLVVAAALLNPFLWLSDYSGVFTLKNDGVYALGLLVSVLAARRLLRRGCDAVTLAAAALGASLTAVKYSGPPTFVLLAGSAAVAHGVMRWRGEAPLSSTPGVVGWSAAAALPVAYAGHFYLRNAYEFGNPLWPFRVPVLPLPFAADLRGSSILDNLHRPETLPLLVGSWPNHLLGPWFVPVVAGLLLAAAPATLGLAWTAWTGRRERSATLWTVAATGGLWLLFAQSFFSAGTADVPLQYLQMDLSSLRYAIAPLILTEVLAAGAVCGAFGEACHAAAGGVITPAAPGGSTVEAPSEPVPTAGSMTPAAQRVIPAQAGVQGSARPTSVGQRAARAAGRLLRKAAAQRVIPAQAGVQGSARPTSVGQRAARAAGRLLHEALARLSFRGPRGVRPVALPPSTRRIPARAGRTRCAAEKWAAGGGAQLVGGGVLLAAVAYRLGQLLAEVRWPVPMMAHLLASLAAVVVAAVWLSVRRPRLAPLVAALAVPVACVGMVRVCNGAADEGFGHWWAPARQALYDAPPTSVSLVRGDTGTLAHRQYLVDFGLYARGRLLQHDARLHELEDFRLRLAGRTVDSRYVVVQSLVPLGYRAADVLHADLTAAGYAVAGQAERCVVYERRPADLAEGRRPTTR